MSIHVRTPQGLTPRPAIWRSHRAPRRLPARALAWMVLGAFVATAAVAAVRVELLPNSAEARAGRPPAEAQPAAPHRLSLTTHPADAKVTITRAGQVVARGHTPFARSIPGGDLTITFALSGHNTLTQRLSLNRRRSLDLYLDPAGLLHHELGTFDTGSNPKQISFTPDGNQIWVTNLGGHGVQVFDASTRKLLDEIRLGDHGGVEVIFTRDGRTAFVSQMETASVFEIDTATHRVRCQLSTGGVWSKVMTLSPNQHRLYVANWSSDNVSEISLDTGKVLRLIPTVRTPRGLYVTPDAKRLFVAGFGKGELQRITLATGASRILLTTNGAMRHLVGDPALGLLYADDMATDEVFVVDLATEHVRKLADTDHTPNTMDLSPDGRVLYVSNRGANNPVSYYIPGPEWGTVLAIDTASGRVLDAIVGGNQTTGLDVSPNGHTLAFSDFLDNRVSLFAIPSYDVLAHGHGGRYREHVAELVK